MQIHEFSEVGIWPSYPAFIQLIWTPDSKIWATLLVLHKALRNKNIWFFVLIKSSLLIAAPHQITHGTARLWDDDLAVVAAA